MTLDSSRQDNQRRQTGLSVFGRPGVTRMRLLKNLERFKPASNIWRLGVNLRAENGDIFCRIANRSSVPTSRANSLFAEIYMLLS